MWTFIFGFGTGLAAYHFGILPLAIDAFIESGARDAIIDTLRNVER